jgi:hypothetical protein
MVKTWFKTKYQYVGLVGFLIAPTPALGKGLFSAYNWGAYYAFTSSYTNLDYDATATEKLPQDCVMNSEVAGKMRCRTYLVPDNSKGLGLFLQKPFQRQGFFYLEPSFTFSTISYSGTVGKKPNQVMSTANSKSVTNDALSTLAPGEQPLKKVLLELYGINWQSYLKLGMTPRYFPDAFLSLGFGIQTVGGRVKVVHTDRVRWVIQPSAYGEIEVVFARMATGYLSAFYSHDQTVLGRYGSNLIEDNPDGTDLSNFKATLINAGIGARLLLPF